MPIAFGAEHATHALHSNLACAGDVAFYVAASMVPSLDALPAMRAYTAEDARLTWRWKVGLSTPYLEPFRFLTY